jgi:hypothetical protein
MDQPRTNSGSDAYSRSRRRETAFALNRYRLTWSASRSDRKSHFTTIGAREKIRLCAQPQGNSFLR